MTAEIINTQYNDKARPLSDVCHYCTWLRFVLSTLSDMSSNSTSPAAYNTYLGFLVTEYLCTPFSFFAQEATI
jgi:hypothetical protein